MGKLTQSFIYKIKLIAGLVKLSIASHRIENTFVGADDRIENGHSWQIWKKLKYSNQGLRFSLKL